MEGNSEKKLIKNMKNIEAQLVNLYQVLKSYIDRPVDNPLYLITPGRPAPIYMEMRERDGKKEIIIHGEHVAAVIGLKEPATFTATIEACNLGKLTKDRKVTVINTDDADEMAYLIIDKLAYIREVERKLYTYA